MQNYTSKNSRNRILEEFSYRDKKEQVILKHKFTYLRRTRQKKIICNKKGLDLIFQEGLSSFMFLCHIRENCKLLECMNFIRQLLKLHTRTSVKSLTQASLSLILRGIVLSTLCSWSQCVKYSEVSKLNASFQEVATQQLAFHSQISKMPVEMELFFLNHLAALEICTHQLL